MKENIFIIANILAIIASVSCYAWTIINMWKGKPNTATDRKKQVKKSIAISAVFFVLLLVISFGLKINVKAYEETGTFNNYKEGVVEIHYKVPFSNPPNLEFNQAIKTDTFIRGPEIIEQRNGSFKVKIDMESWHFNWVAKGQRQ